MNHRFSLVGYWGVFYASIEGDSGQSLAAKPSKCSCFRTLLGFFSEDVKIRCHFHLHLTGFLCGAFHLQVLRKVK